MNTKTLYEERLSSPRTEALFVVLTLLFLALSVWRGRHTFSEYRPEISRFVQLSGVSAVGDKAEGPNGIGAGHCLLNKKPRRDDEDAPGVDTAGMFRQSRRCWATNLRRSEMTGYKLNRSRFIVGVVLVIIAVLMFLFARGDYATAGVIGIGVLGLISIAISGSRL